MNSRRHTLNPKAAKTLDYAIKYCVDVHASCRSEEKAELYLQLGTWLEELQEYERMGPGHRARVAAQTLIEEIGAPGPESVHKTAERAVAIIRNLRDRLQKANETVEQLQDELAQAETIIKLQRDTIEEARMKKQEPGI